MAYSLVRYTGNGTTASYTFPFSYISSDHVKVFVDGTAPGSFSFLNANTVTISPTPVVGSVITIQRITPKDTTPVNFQDGSVLLERDLDLLATFDLYIAQEASDAVADTISSDTTGRWDGQGKRLGNIAAAVNPDEVIIKATLDYEYPAVAEVALNKNNIAIVGSDLGVVTGAANDLGSITEATGSNPAAGSSKIATVANNITDVISVADNILAIQAAEGNASSAAASATAAASSATAAASSASSASTSATSATSSQTAAATSATNAALSATSAAGSATTATSKASDAAGSATAAASSASGASSSASTASASAATAATKASEASTSASNAATSATNAGNSAAAAASSASTASTQATNAASSATAAAGSATAASGSATSASSSATTATGAASTATTQAANAASSATSAASSASTATTQAAAASSSATSAAASAASAAALLDNFDDRYLGPKSSAPTVDNDGNALIVGALYFDTTSGKMRVYTATGWVDASSASQAALTKYKFTATASQTTFSGADANGLTLAYLAGGEVVALNGSVLVGGGDDYTASNGTSVVLTVGATVGDTLEVYAFSSFSIASLNGSAIVDGSITPDKLVSPFDLGVLP